MDIESSYQKILAEIKLDHRALTRFKRDDLEFLKDALGQSLHDHSQMEKILCLLDHSATAYRPLETLLIHCLNTDLPPQLSIFVLNCMRKHIIVARGQTGERLTYDFLEALKKKLYSRSPEVVEWTLRTIEECGNQGVYFLSEFDKIKPPPWKWFNEHQRAVREIIAMLERRWSRFENPEK